MGGDHRAPDHEQSTGAASRATVGGNLSEKAGVVGCRGEVALPLLEDLPECTGKSVLLRADLNVPLISAPDSSREVADDFRIRAVLPTIAWLQEHGAEVTICSHLGRPRGQRDPRYDLAPVRARLNELVEGVELTENLRFDPGEEANDDAFVAALVAGHDLYVDDAFGACHRAHASIVGPPRLLPSAAGRLVEREVEVLSRLIEEPQRPFVAVVGGAKVGDKIGVIEALARRVDTICVGGGMAFTFLAALGHSIGRSLCEPDWIERCRELLDRGVEILLPSDTVCVPSSAPLLNGVDALDHLGAGVAPVTIEGRDLSPDSQGVDIGPETAAAFAAVIRGAATVFWNGPMGVFEDPRAAEGTAALARAVAACPGFTVVGGGDSAAALARFGLAGEVDFVSSGGGASLEFIEHGDLPGLAALRGAVNAPLRAGRRASGASSSAES
jgi:phosphoglycerate kinase